MSKKSSGPWIGTVVVLALGCAHGYAETAGTQEATRSLSGVSQFAIPAGNPQGAVYVMSMGPAQLTGEDGRSESFLHLRVTAASPSDVATGRVDPREIVVRFEDGRWVFATHTSNQLPGAPVTINRGPQGDIDVYFPMATPEPAAKSAFRERVTTRQSRAAVSMFRLPVPRAGKLFPSDF